MNFIDLIIIVPVIWFGYKGFRKGFIIEVASLASLLLGIWGGLYFTDWVSPYIVKWFEVKSDYVPLISFAVIFVIILCIIYFIAKIIEKIVKAVGLGLPNRIVGAVLGAAKTILIIGTILLILNNYDINNKLIKNETKDKSLLYKPLTNIVVKIYPSLKNIVNNTLK